MPERNLTDAPRPTAEMPGVVRLGASTLDLARYAVLGDDGEVRLRPRSADVLRYLVAHAGRVVTKHEIVEAVWGDVAVTDDSLVQCLVEIRRALGVDQSLVRTVRGRGYLLDGVSPVVPDDIRFQASAGAEAAIATAVSSDNATETVPVAVPVRSRRRAWSVVAATAAVVVAALAAFGMRGAPAARSVLTDTLVPEARASLEQGQAILRDSRAQVDLERARRLYLRAVELDPGYAPAHAALGNVLVMLSGFGVQPPLDLLPAAGRAARHALELDPALAAGWQALAHVQTQAEWDWRGAEHSYRRALALDPSAPMNMIFAHLLAGVGRLDEAVVESDRLLAVAPREPLRLTSNCIVKYLARRYAAAVAACDQAVRAKADYSVAHFWRALTLSAEGRHAEAMDAALAARVGVGFEPTWLVGYVHARAGRATEAREVLVAIETRATHAYTPPVDIALLRAAVGDTVGALSWLERAHREHGRWLELLAVHPAADPLRGQARFRALLAALRLPELP